MSYILDALKKAERERHWAKVPTLGTVHARSADRGRRAWPWIGASVALLGAAASIWFLRAAVTPSVERSAHSTAVATRSAPPVEHPAPVNPAVALARPAEPTTSPGPASEQRGAQPEPTAKASAPTPAHRTPSPVLQSEAPKAEPRKPEPARTSAVPASPGGLEDRVVPTPAGSAPLTAAVPAGPTAPATGSTKPAPPGAGPSLPTVKDMAPADREAMPKLTLQFLVYSDIPAERLVFINDKKYLEGQSIDGKVLVEAIRPNGALLSYQGKRFMLSQ